MMILNYSNVETAELARLVDEKLGGKYDVEKRDAFAAFPSKEEYGYGQGNEQGTPDATAGRENPSGSRQAASLREKASAAIEAAIAKEITTPTGKPKPDGFLRERNAASNQSAASEYDGFSETAPDTPNFKQWTGGLPLIRHDDTRLYKGGPAVFEGYHGTTHGNIEAIDPAPEKGSTEGFLGNGFYVTTGQDDVNENYAGVGPDLAGRINKMADEVSQEMYDDAYAAKSLVQDWVNESDEAPSSLKGIDVESISEKKLDKLLDQFADEIVNWHARGRVAGDTGGLVMPVYVRLKNPLDLRPGGKQYYMEQSVDENGDYVGERTGDLVDLAEAVREVVDELIGSVEANTTAAGIYEDAGYYGMGGYDGMGGRSIQESITKHLGAPYGEDGNLISSGEILRRAAEKVGYDGMIMDADHEFGNGRINRSGNIARGMAGVKPGTLHMITFDRLNVKSALGNNGNFSLDNPNVSEYNQPDSDVVRDFMSALSGEVGWQEVGGRLIRDTEGNAVARTKWIPHSDFWPGYRTMGGTLTEAEGRAVFRRALEGAKLSPRMEALIKYAEDYAVKTLHSETDANFYGRVEALTADDLNDGITSFYREDGIPNPHQAEAGFNNINKNVNGTVSKMREFAKDKGTDALPFGLQFLGRRQIVDIYNKLLPSLKDYDKEVQLMDAEKSGSAHDADKIAKRWGDLPQKTADDLADIMHAATLAQYDPDDPKTSNRLLTDEQKAKAADIRKRWINMPDEAKKIYREARDMYRNQWKSVESAIIERIQRAVVMEKDRKVLIDDLKLKFETQLHGVYFPLARFGDYFITVKKPGQEQNVAVVFGESMAEAKRLRDELMAEYGKGDFIVSPVQAKAKFNASQSGPNKEFIGKLFQTIESQRTNDEISNVAADSLIDSINQLYLTNLPDLSWAKHALHRQGIAGYSRDARRAFAQNMFHGGFHIARIKHADIMQDHIDSMRKHISDNRNDPRFDAVKAQRVTDEMVMRHQKMLETDNNPVASFLTGLGFVWHMGLSPASAIVNLSQTALIALPMMGAAFGIGNATGALLRASKEAASSGNDMGKNLKGDEKTAYDRAVREGIIDLTLAHDLAGVSAGKDNQLNRTWSPIMKAASWMFHQAELFNRQTTFMASYRLALKQGMAPDAAYDAASKMTYDSHFDYSASNRPRVMMGPVQRVLFLFKQYGQNMAYTLARNAYQSVKGATPEERAVALKSLSGMMLMTGMTTGAFGLPFVVSGAWFAAASALGSDKDDPWDSKVALRRYLADAFGKDVAEMMTHGLTRAFFPGDLSSRIGLDTLFFSDGGPALEGAQWYNSMAQTMLGPVAGIGLNVVKGAADVSNGDTLRGIAGMMPIAISNPLKALRFANEGVKDKTGIQILEELTFPELAQQSVGFAPTRLKEAYEGSRAVYNVDKAVMNRRKELLRDFAKASINGDVTEDIAKQIIAFSEKQPQAKITGSALRSAIKDRIMRVEQADDGIYLPKKRRALAELGSFANTGDDEED
jgi:hypothetical protein